MKYDAIEAAPELLGDSGDARRRYAKHGQHYRWLASAGCRPRAGHADDAERRVAQHGAADVVETGEVDMSATKPSAFGNPKRLHALGDNEGSVASAADSKHGIDVAAGRHKAGERLSHCRHRLAAIGAAQKMAPAG